MRAIDTAYGLNDARLRLLEGLDPWEVAIAFEDMHRATEAQSRRDDYALDLEWQRYRKRLQQRVRTRPNPPPRLCECGCGHYTKGIMNSVRSRWCAGHWNRKSS
jgi:hypothetical protein